MNCWQTATWGTKWHISDTSNLYFKRHNFLRSDFDMYVYRHYIMFVLVYRTVVYSVSMIINLRMHYLQTPKQTNTHTHTLTHICTQTHTLTQTQTYIRFCIFLFHTILNWLSELKSRSENWCNVTMFCIKIMWFASVCVRTHVSLCACKSMCK